MGRAGRGGVKRWSSGAAPVRRHSAQVESSRCISGLVMPAASRKTFRSRSENAPQELVLAMPVNAHPSAARRRRPVHNDGRALHALPYAHPAPGGFSGACRCPDTQGSSPRRLSQGRDRVTGRSAVQYEARARPVPNEVRVVGKLRCRCAAVVATVGVVASARYPAHSTARSALYSTPFAASEVTSPTQFDHAGDGIDRLLLSHIVAALIFAASEDGSRCPVGGRLLCIAFAFPYLPCFSSSPVDQLPLYNHRSVAAQARLGVTRLQQPIAGGPRRSRHSVRSVRGGRCCRRGREDSAGLERGLSAGADRHLGGRGLRKPLADELTERESNSGETSRRPRRI